MAEPIVARSEGGRGDGKYSFVLGAIAKGKGGCLENSFINERSP